MAPKRKREQDADAEPLASPATDAAAGPPPPPPPGAAAAAALISPAASPVPEPAPPSKRQKTGPATENSARPATMPPKPAVWGKSKGKAVMGDKKDEQKDEQNASGDETASDSASEYEPSSGSGSEDGSGSSSSSDDPTSSEEAESDDDESDSGSESSESDGSESGSGSDREPRSGSGSESGDEPKRGTQLEPNDEKVLPAGRAVAGRMHRAVAAERIAGDGWSDDGGRYGHLQRIACEIIALEPRSAFAAAAAATIPPARSTETIPAGDAKAPTTSSAALVNRPQGGANSASAGAAVSAGDAKARTSSALVNGAQGGAHSASVGAAAAGVDGKVAGVRAPLGEAAVVRGLMFLSGDRGRYGGADRWVEVVGFGAGPRGAPHVLAHWLLEAGENTRGTGVRHGNYARVMPPVWLPLAESVDLVHAPARMKGGAQVIRVTHEVELAPEDDGGTDMTDW
jgi:hypothetical protein